MDNVKTFFKTLLWTLIVLIILIGGFFSYIKFLNKDLGQKVAGVIYVQDALECPVCEECEACEEVKSVDCSIVSGGVAVTTSDINFDREFSSIQDKLNEIMDMIDGTDRSVDEYEVVDSPALEADSTVKNAGASTDISVEELLKRIEELEKE